MESEPNPLVQKYNGGNRLGTEHGWRGTNLILVI